MSDTLRTILDRLCLQHSVDRNEAEEALKRLASGEESESLISSFLTVFRMRNVSVSELLGFRDAMLSLAVRPTLELSQPLIDLCGTGGDGKDTFNISTLASFVVAGAGYKVAKHGNYSASSVCGSSNVLEALGVRFTTKASLLQRQLDTANICYLHAPLFHPAMKHVAGVRQALKVRTIFNLLGPTVNPLGVRRQMIGVFSYQMARLYGFSLPEVLENFSVVHSTDGYDEVSLTSPVRIWSETGETVLHPSDFGFETVLPRALNGGNSIQDGADIFQAVLSGRGTIEQEQVVLANAAVAVSVQDRALSLKEALEQCYYSLKSGAAQNSFEELRALSVEENNGCS